MSWTPWKKVGWMKDPIYPVVQPINDGQLLNDQLNRIADHLGIKLDLPTPGGSTDVWGGMLVVAAKAIADALESDAHNKQGF